MNRTFSRMFRMRNRSLAVFSLIASNLLIRKIQCQTPQNKINDEDEKLKRKLFIEKVNKDLKKYPVGESSTIEEGKIYPFTIKNGDEDYKILMVRYKGKVYSVAATCTHDGETDLSEGICFGNKLFCPKHGCQYDITNGWAESPPAIDYLPQFYVDEKNGFIHIVAPKVVPKKILPQFSYRNYNDLRKVIVVGQGAAAYGCIQTLRECSYTGQLTLITNEPHLLINKIKLTKKFKNAKEEDFLFRTPEWYTTNDIEVIFGNSCAAVNNQHQNMYIELDDGVRMGYDLIMFCTGSTYVHEDIDGLRNAHNVHYLDNLADHRKIQQTLEKVKSLSVIGINQQSLETIATIRQEYPHINVNLIDINEQNVIQFQYGNTISDVLLDLHSKHGVKIYENYSIDKVERDDKFNHIYLNDGTKLSSESIFLFPNQSVPDTEMLEQSDKDLEFDKAGRLRVDFTMRSDTKRIFGAGSMASADFALFQERVSNIPIQNDQYPGRHWTANFQQGVTAAYNILALNVPWHQIPHSYTEQYGKYLLYAGYDSKWDDCHIMGDVKNWDFISLYSYNDFVQIKQFYDLKQVVGAVGTPDKQNKVHIVNELLRISMLPFLSEIKDGTETFESFERLIRLKNKSGCYKQLIWQDRYDQIEEFVMWQVRDNWSRWHERGEEVEIVTKPKGKIVEN